MEGKDATSSLEEGIRTQGCGEPEMLRGQPAMVKVSEERARKSPPPFVLVLEVTMVTIPP